MSESGSHLPAYIVDSRGETEFLTNKVYRPRR